MSDAQPNSPVFFLDRNHGLLIRDTLKRVGIQVVAHRDLAWKDDKTDVEIIRECAAKNYVILSGDKAMERVPEERQEIIKGKCKVFMFDDTGKTRTDDWIASVLVARQRIIEIIGKANGPLFVTIKPCRSIGHIGKPRFVEKAGGGWKADHLTIEVASLPLENPNQPKRSPQQTTLRFP